MKLIIFAGGLGMRLWPLSRKNSPKQFEILKDNKSTLEMAVDRVKDFGLENIYISTNEKYIDLVKKHIPDLNSNNILVEPARRDLAAAVGLTLMRLKKQGVVGTVAVLWADHFMEKEENFRIALKQGEEILKENSDKFIFLGETPRFANHNLGWIYTGKEIKDGQYEFLGWKYRPELLECEEMFETESWLWNPGYFVFDIDFVLGLYKKLKPEMYKALQFMVGDENKIRQEYKRLETISFDNAILEKVEPNQAVVLKVDLEWSDPGTLYALKEALVDKEDKNFTKGKVLLQESKDCFVYNEEKNKLVTTVGLDGYIVVNTKDAILVCHKSKVPEVKKMLGKFEEEGLEKYL